MTVDVSVEDLVAFVKKGIKNGGTWLMSTPGKADAQTLINIGALRWMTLIPVDPIATSDDVLHLDPET